MLSPKVVVVGGSLGGLCHAVALRALGYAVDVFEKSSGRMRDRGAGIILQPEVTELFARYGVAAPEEISVPLWERRYLAPDGSVLQGGPMPQAMTSWDALYRKLRARFPDDRYHAGCRLLRFEPEGGRVTAHFEGGRREECDLLVGADGPGSTVRHQVLPEVRSEYAGYVVWRGVVPEGQEPDLAAAFAGRFTFLQAPHMYILCYLIPGPDGALAPGQCRLTLAASSGAESWRPRSSPSGPTRRRPGAGRRD